MRTIHTVTQATQFPKFWNEEWLQIAIDELDSRKMTPDEKASLEIIIARNAVAVTEEKRKINQEKEKFVKYLLKSENKTIEQIAEITGATTEFVLSVKQKLAANK